MTTQLPDDVGLMDGVTALPRDNGELVFDTPWEARALAMAVALVEKLGVSWDEFRHRLMHAIADHPDRPYYESWTDALESLVLAHGLSTSSAIDAATPAERPSL